MFKKNYRRAEVDREWHSDLEQKFNIKCFIDIGVFILSIILFLIFAITKKIAPYDIFIFINIFQFLKF